MSGNLIRFLGLCCECIGGDARRLSVDSGRGRGVYTIRSLSHVLYRYVYVYTHERVVRLHCAELCRDAAV
eukprot:scaffold176901_cov31-Tisochrysis_lutea.AAC.4